MNPERKDRLDSMFEAFSILAEEKYVYVCDIRENFSRWSQRAVDYFGLPDTYMFSADSIWEEHVHPEDRESYRLSIDKIFSGEAVGHDMQYRALATNGSYVVCTCRGVVIRDENGNPEYFGGAIQNHSSLSYLDTATGLRSLYGFFDDIKASFWNQESCVLLLLGLNGFSDVNDLYGYTFGNSVLRSLANMIQSEFANGGAVYRMDGTKFAIVSHSLTAQQVCTIYTILKNKVAHKFYVDKERLSLSLNAGIVNIENFNINTEIVYSCLKYAYYESKNRKQGEAVIFTDALTEANRLHIEKLNTIRNCVSENCRGFYLCYQPIVDAETEHLKGMEALIRWHSDEYGTVSPIQFIPVLEQDSLFPELGKWILRQAMTDGRKIVDTHPDFVVNINLSYAQLEMNSFTAEVMELLHETGLPPQNLCLEITERCKILDIARLKNMFRFFREQGIKVALDDFGTGFSSLGILRELPVDIVKIDREYVKNVQASHADKSTIQFISNLAETFSAGVCVEGVESAEMRDILRDYQVSSFQGYYYSKPIPIDKFMEKYA